VSDRQTDRQTEFLYQYSASTLLCWRAIRTTQRRTCDWRKILKWYERKNARKSSCTRNKATTVKGWQKMMQATHNCDGFPRKDNPDGWRGTWNYLNMDHVIRSLVDFVYNNTRSVVTEWTGVGMTTQLFAQRCSWDWRTPACSGARRTNHKIVYKNDPQHTISRWKDFMRRRHSSVDKFLLSAKRETLCASPHATPSAPVASLPSCVRLWHLSCMHLTVLAWRHHWPISK